MPGHNWWCRMLNASPKIAIFTGMNFLHAGPIQITKNYAYNSYNCFKMEFMSKYAWCWDHNLWSQIPDAGPNIATFKGLNFPQYYLNFKPLLSKTSEK